ncbi:MAG: hypothetical protein CMJ41_01965 [Phycisphaerae bacterium]|nr:hypothetical protein [Phycisphaerae bacterium]
MIKARSITKSYRGLDVLRGVSIDVEPGTIHGFVGPNGAGKSTFLKILIGVVHRDGGQLDIDGFDPATSVVQVRRRIGYSPSETALYHRMRTGELLEFSLCHHLHADLARGRMLLELLGVPSNRRVGALSHGMKRKLLIAQAIASGTPLLVLDEPMEALDPEARRRVEELLRAEVDSGRTIFFSSHDLASTQRLCSRVTFLHRGRVLRDGLMDELLEAHGGVLHLEFREPVLPEQLPRASSISWEGHGEAARLVYQGQLESVLSTIDGLPIKSIRDDSGDLEQLFDRLYMADGETVA